jgi:hypothetical protein
VRVGGGRGSCPQGSRCVTVAGELVELVTLTRIASLSVLFV